MGVVRSKADLLPARNHAWPMSRAGYPGHLDEQLRDSVQALGFCGFDPVGAV